MSTKKAAIENYSFEEALQELEGIVRELEAGQAELDQSIQDYEKGMQLRDHCMKKLEAARMRVEKIIQNQQGEVSTAPLDEQES